MSIDILKQKKIDPSESKQTFSDIAIKLHCCRYWYLSEWEFTNMAFPFWRIYHNTIKGASVLFQGITTELTEDKIVVIPPNTSFSNFFISKNKSIVKESIVGKRISEDNQIVLNEKKVTDHFFIHFNLGLPFDFAKPGVYEIPVNEQLISLLKSIKERCILKHDEFDFVSTLHVNNLIINILSLLPRSIWQNIEIDKRILMCLQYIRSNLSIPLYNKSLAEQSNMATNAFARLFRLNTGESIQQYTVKCRIEKAREMLHHTNLSIDNIAFECGFCDRHHFSKAFKNVMLMSPGYYKRHLTLQ
jgi:AraC-like DNA-binding protein